MDATGVIGIGENRSVYRDCDDCPDLHRHRAQCGQGRRVFRCQLQSGVTAGGVVCPAANSEQPVRGSSPLALAIAGRGSLREAVGHPSDGGTSAPLSDETMSDARHNEQAHSAARVAQPLHVVLRHLGANNRVSRALREKDGNVRRQGRWSIASQQRTPRFNVAGTADRQEILLQRPLGNAARLQIESRTRCTPGPEDRSSALPRAQQRLELARRKHVPMTTVS